MSRHLPKTSCDYCGYRTSVQCKSMDQAAGCHNLGRNPADVMEINTAVDRPQHYARWAMEPVEFIAINNLPWWLANLIKYTMRFDAKDGLKDLYKGRSYLDMKIRSLEGVTRFWEKPVATERALNGK